MQEQQAAERLAARMERAKTRQIHLNSDDLQKPAFSQYREPSMIKSKSVNLSSNIEGNPNLNKESEEFDDSEMEKPEGLGITYTVYE